MSRSGRETRREKCHSVRWDGGRDETRKRPNASIRFARLQTGGYKPFAKLPITRDDRFRNSGEKNRESIRMRGSVVFRFHRASMKTQRPPSALTTRMFHLRAPFGFFFLYNNASRAYIVYKLKCVCMCERERG